MRRRRRAREAEEKDEKKEPEEAVVPVDPVNEAVVLAAVMVSRTAADELLPAISSDHFFARGHGKAWDALREMHRRGLYYDPQTVVQVSGGEVDPAYLEGLAKERPERPPNLRHHVEALRWDHARASAARGPLGALLRALHDVTTPADKVRMIAKQLADGFSGHGSDAYLATTAEVARTHKKYLVDRMNGKACYPYGLPDLDIYNEGPDAGFPRMVPGSAPGFITCITGTSATAKTSVACRIALEMARAGRKVLIGAWETGAGPSLELCAAISLGMSRSDVSVGRYNQQDLDDLLAEMERLGDMPGGGWIKYFKLPFGRARGGDRSPMNDRQLDLVRQVIGDSRCEVFFADLMRRALKETRPDDEEQALFRLQSDAQEQGVHHVWLHQINLKQADQAKRRDNRPSRDVMKGSGAWYEVPDTIFGLHREALYKDVEDNRLEVIVLKHRYGRFTGAIEFEWDPEHVSLERGRQVEYRRGQDLDDMDDFFRGKKSGRF